MLSFHFEFISSFTFNAFTFQFLSHSQCWATTTFLTFRIILKNIDFIRGDKKITFIFVVTLKNFIFYFKKFVFCVEKHKRKIVKHALNSFNKLFLFFFLLLHSFYARKLLESEQLQQKRTNIPQIRIICRVHETKDLQLREHKTHEKLMNEKNWRQTQAHSDSHGTDA